jgi:hypothetical protein
MNFRLGVNSVSVSDFKFQRLRWGQILQTENTRPIAKEQMVRLAGLEPATCCFVVSGVL